MYMSLQILTIEYETAKTEQETARKRAREATERMMQMVTAATTIQVCTPVTHAYLVRQWDVMKINTYNVNITCASGIFIIINIA